MNARDFNPRPPPAGHKVFKTVEEFRLMWPRTALEANRMELVEIDEDHAVMTMPVADSGRQPMGLLHGGMTMLLAESVASLHACWGVDLSKRQPVGIEISGSHVRSSTDGSVRAVARVVRRSSSLIVHTVEVFDAADGSLLTTCRVTNFYRRANAEQA
ncbi:MAG TPA: PaaI family thioesterase [Opitutaceae bacterium]